MNKMQTRICLLLALVFAFAAEARMVTSDEARTVARAWVNRGKDRTRMGVKFPSVSADAAKAHTTTNGATFYSVKMTGGGTVFLSSDTEFEPVIGFTSETTDFTNIATNSPLWALLNCGVSRMKAANTPALKLTTSSTSLTTSSSTTGKNAKKWATLIDEGRDLDNPRRLTTSAAAKKHDYELDDLRVPNLVKSQWSQSLAQGRACYNYYTPSSADPTKPTPGSTANAVCGCVATAMSQIMRYFKYPTQSMPQITERCSYDGTYMDLTTQGGTYDWDSMPLVPNSGTLTEAQCQAIGKITSDAGISINMAYAPDGSGAIGAYAGEKLKTAFGYKSAPCFWDENGITKQGAVSRTEALGKLMFCNFDAGLPVYVTVPGHAIFADGYGYDANGVDYVHFNMGWAGSYDFWYNIPNLTESSADFDELNAVVYNIFTDKDEEYAVMSGRILDDDDLPIANAEVTIFNSDGEVVETTQSNDKGIWSAILKGGRNYEVEATDGHLVAQISVNLTAPNPTRGFVYSVIGMGNSWGNDMVLAEPTVRVGENVYTTLDKALKAATNGNDLVEIILPTTVKRPATVLADCTIIATNADAFASAVTCLNNATITVTNGVTLTVSNVVFDVANKYKTIQVLEGGALKVGGVCMLEAIETVAWSNLVVGATLDKKTYFRIDCTGAGKEGETFATATVDYETATNCANQLIHYSKTRLVGEAYTNDAGKVFFKWVKGHPADAAAVARTIVGETKLNYGAIDDAIEDIEDETGPIEIVMLKDDTFVTKYALKSSSVTIRGEGEETPVLTTKTTAGFEIGTGTALTLKDITFLGTEPTDQVTEICFIQVDGGALTLDDGATLNGIVGRVDRGSGVIEFNSGMVTMKEGASIINCSAQGLSTGTGYGGAIYALGKDCQLNLLGGVITNCFASSVGGGVYACGYQGAAEINVHGYLTIANNRSNGFANDDIYLLTAKGLAGFKVTGAVKGCIGVRYASSILTGNGNAVGASFITNAIQGNVDETTLYSFFSDALGEGYIAAVGTGDKAGKLVWAVDPRDPRQCDEGEASARIITGNKVSFWREVSDALNEATDNCIVEVLTNNCTQIAGNDYVPLASNVIIRGKNVTLRTETGAALGYRLLREKDVQITIAAGHELVVTNLDICGCELSSTPVTNTVTLFDVDGGKLTLDDAGILYVFGDTNRNANAITVYNGGVLTMQNGAQVDTCYNLYKGEVKDTENGAGGGILIDNATAYLRDMYVSRCLGWKGGGVFACNDSKIYVSGRTCISASSTPDYQNYSNLELSDDSELILDGEMTGFIMETPPYQGDTNLVAKVEYGWSVTSLTNSAAGFERDLDGELAVAVTNGTQALIVWCGAVKDGTYTDKESTLYALAGEMPVVVPPAPTLLPILTNPEKIAGELAKLEDRTVANSISSLDVYNDFCDWASKVDGGKEKVAKSNKAYVSYQFGTTDLMTQPTAPTVEITEIENTEGGLKVSVIVKDGEDPVAVAAAKVAEMFEATSDVSDWTKTIGLTVQNPVQNDDKSVTFDVTPADNAPSAFIRLKY